MYILPASGLDFIELDSYLTGSEESVAGEDDTHHETEASEDDEVEERPRKFDY